MGRRPGPTTARIPLLSVPLRATELLPPPSGPIQAPPRRQAHPATHRPTRAAGPLRQTIHAPPFAAWTAAGAGPLNAWKSLRSREKHRLRESVRRPRA